MNQKMEGDMDQRSLSKKGSRKPILQARIERRQIVRSRLASGPGFAWRYVYDIRMPNGEYLAEGIERLSAAETYARAYRYEPVRTWGNQANGVGNTQAP